MKIFSTDYHAGDEVDVYGIEFGRCLIEGMEISLSPDGNHLSFSIMLGKLEREEPTETGLTLTQLWLNRRSYAIGDRQC